MSYDISIIIPTYNRFHSLTVTLESLLRQHYQKDKFEVIVVDDGSNVEIDSIIRKFRQSGLNIKYMRQRKKGPAAARNLGVKYATSNLIGFVDDDCILDKEWVTTMVSIHKKNPEYAVVGGYTWVDKNNLKAVVSQFLANGAMYAYIDNRKKLVFFPTCNVSIKKYIFSHEVFNEEFPYPAGEDLEFFWRLFKRGIKFFFTEKAFVYHNRTHNIFTHIKQSYLYGKGNYLVKIYFPDHPALEEIDERGKICFIYSLLRGLFLTPFFALRLSYHLADSDIIKGDIQFILSSFYFWLHKVFYYIGVFIQSLQSNFTRCNVPRSIILDLTHRCNLNCVICDIRKDKDRVPLKTEEVKRILKEAKQLAIKKFTLSGGEPLLREDILQILDYCRKLSYPVGVLTNGVILDDDNFFEKIKPYIITGIVTLCISFDSLKPSLHDEIRGKPGTHAQTLRVLMKLAHLKDIHPDIKIMVISIIMNKNLEEFIELLEFLRSLKVNQIQIQPILNNNLFLHQRNSVSRYWISQEHFLLLDKTIADIIAFKKRNPSLLINSEKNLELIKKYYRGELKAEDVNCGRGIKDMLISNNGDVTTCFDILGNIRKKSLYAIWRMRNLEKIHSAIQNCPAPCILPCFE